MKPEAQRIAIATLDGWKWEGGKRNNRKAKNRLIKGGDACTVWRGCGFGGTHIPNYLANRDAIITVVLAQPREVQWEWICQIEKMAFSRILRDEVLSEVDRLLMIATATAEQHCHALLVATGRWEA